MDSFQVKYLGAILTVLVSRFSEVVCAGCNTPVSTSGVLNVNQDVTAPSSKPGYSASAVFTTGWCANSQDDKVLEINFPNSHGIKGIVVKRVDQTNYPTRVLVKYVPNGGSQIQDIPVPNGLVLELNTSLSESTINFSLGIAVKRLQFTVTAFTGSTPCLKLELLGCPINELCPGGCMNGGVCQMENACACPAGSSGTHCEIKDCTPLPLGLSNGGIPDSSVTVSSQDSHYTKDQIGNAQTNEGWCPSSADKAPWVEVKLSKPMAVSVFEFNFVKRHENDGGRAFIQEFDLHYISPLDSSKSCRSFAKLCSTNFCLNGGTCMGENICQCPSGFVGTKCETPTNNIQQISLAFVNITNNILITARQSFQFQVHGNVHIQTVAGQKDPVISISGTNSYIQMNTTSVSCITDIAHCTSGFTFRVDANFVQLLDNTFIINSGGHLPGHKGVALYYSHNKLYYIVSTSTLTWTLIVNYKPVLNVWQHFEITWNHNLGVEVLVNGHSLGTASRPVPGGGTITLPLCVACSHTQTTVNVNMLVTGIISWTIDRNELVNAGVKP
ncbi:hypothetical protein MAR_015558, partial [Mya arenaria]